MEHLIVTQFQSVKRSWDIDARKVLHAKRLTVRNAQMIDLSLQETINIHIE
jgi:hypothetical protein